MVELLTYGASSERVISRENGKNADMLMDVTVKRMAAGQCITLCDSGKETAILLIEGGLAFQWQGRTESASRKDVFDVDNVACLHVPRGVSVTLTANAACEVLLQLTTNPGDFPPKFYRKADCAFDTFGKDLYDNFAVRDVLTIFDYVTAPYSNMVLGEIYAHKSCWTSYIPHSHDQPEIYYYRFDKPQGFGACFIGDEASTVFDGSYAAIPGGKTHPQCCAPGYRMYYAWMIRHFDGNPWTERVNDPKHTWLLEK